MQQKAGLEVTRLTNKSMLRSVGNCIRLGRPLLIEDIGEFLDPALDPVLARAVFNQQGRSLIRLGDDNIDYNDDFRLYVSTKLPNPHYLPEVCIKVTVINFTVTMSGLEDQLLGALVKKERPDVEKKKNNLLVSMASDKLQLKQLEEKILRMLKDSEGVVVDNVGLIETLGESKIVSKTISERLVESEKTNEQITIMREQYRPVATRGSIIYFVMADLARIDPMYQFSLSYFQRLYDLCIDEAEKSDDLDTRLRSLKAYMTLNVYKNVCRGLFEAHKLIFSFLTCIQILREQDTVSAAEWSMLLRGAGMVTNPAVNPMPEGVSENGWNLVAALQEGIPDTFGGLVDHVISAASLSDWQRWATCNSPQTEALPKPWKDQLNSMQRMLLLKAFREEKLVFAIQDFVVEHLGEEFVQSPPVSMRVVHGETRADTPIVFILSVGADPTGVLYTYAKEVDYMDRLHLCSLG